MNQSAAVRSKPRATLARGEGRDAILTSAYELMLQERMSSVSHRSVATRAGVAVSLIRYHFATRTALLVACIKRLMAERHQGAIAALESCRPDLDAVDCGRLAVAAYTGPNTSDAGLTATLGAILDSAREDRALSDFLVAERPVVESDLAAVLAACGWDSANATLITHIIDGALVAGIVDKQVGLLDLAAGSCAQILMLTDRR